MTSSRLSKAIWLTVAFVCFVTPALAVEDGMSPWPKGFGGFMSGVLPPQSGLYQQNFYYYFNGKVGQAVRDATIQSNVDLTFNAGFISGLYVSDLHFWGAQYAAAGLLSWAGADLTATISAPRGSASVSASNNTLGDSFLTPVILGWHDGLFNWSLALNVYVPTGPYHNNRQDLTNPQLNLGRNTWGFMPQYSITYFDPQTGLDVSGSFVYVTVSNNSATNYQSGDLVQLDWAAGKHFGEGGAWEAGIAGNVVEQVGPDRGQGARLGPFKAQSIGLGPAINYTSKFQGIPVVFSAKWEHDLQTRNTFKGDVANASATFVF